MAGYDDPETETRGQVCREAIIGALTAAAPETPRFGHQGNASGQTTWGEVRWPDGDRA
jgi:hypothetical protein